MDNKLLSTKTSLLYAALSCCFATTLSGANGGSFELDRMVIASGGGESVGGVFSLNATIGQADSGPVLRGGTFSLQGGFWHRSQSGPLVENIFRDGFE